MLNAKTIPRVHHSNRSHHQVSELVLLFFGGIVCLAAMGMRYCLPLPPSCSHGWRSPGGSKIILSRRLLCLPLCWSPGSGASALRSWRCFWKHLGSTTGSFLQLGSSHFFSGPILPRSRRFSLFSLSS